MGTTSNAIFTGSSQFSNDFQQVISRAVSLASLPMQSLQADVTNLTSQSTEMGKLNSGLSNLQSAIAGLGSALGRSSFTALSSSNAVASTALTGTPSAGSFSVEVDSTGVYAGAQSSDALPAVADPARSSISGASTYTLTVGNDSYSIAPAANTLSALAAAINQNPGANVQATLINLGTTASPDYRLSLKGTQLGDLPIQLSAELTDSDGNTSEQDLLTAGAVGAPATYRVNGQPADPADPLTTDSPTITASPGVSVTLNSVGTATITISQSADALSQALSKFVSAYNAVTSEINANRGSGTGALQGQSVLGTLSQILRHISGYSSAFSGISSLTSLGLVFDDKGVLSLDSTIFAAATKGNLAQVSSFLGSSTTGGFLKAAGDALTALTDPINGTIQSGITNLQAQITRDNQSIRDEQDRITTLQHNLNTQMAAADSAIAAMEQQYTYLSSVFAAMQVNARNNG